MLENGKIGVSQFTILVVIFTLGSSILVAPSGLAHDAKQDAWIAEIFAFLFGLLLVWLYTQLGSRFQNQTFTQYIEVLLGKWLGKIISYSYYFYLLIFSALLLREIGDFLTTQILPNTPIQFIHIIFLVIVIMGTRLGLETFVRASEIFFPWILGLFFIMAISISPQIKLENIQPIFEGGIKPILKGAIPALGLPYLELVIFLMIFPYVNKIAKVKKAFFIAVAMAGIMLILISFLSITTLGAQITAREVYPTYVLAKKISIGHFFERIEALMAGIWFLSIYFKLTLCFYASTLGFAQTLQLKDYRFLSIPFGAITIVLSLVASPNNSYFQLFISQIWTPYSLTYGLFLPLLLYIVALVKTHVKRNDRHGG